MRPVVVKEVCMTGAEFKCLGGILPTPRPLPTAGTDA